MRLLPLTLAALSLAACTEISVPVDDAIGAAPDGTDDLGIVLDPERTPPTADAGPEAAPEAAPDPQPAPEHPLISDALADVCPDAGSPGEWPNSLAKGEDMHRVTLDYPGAVCNDGTPAVMFVRRGAEARQGRWVFHVQGGGGCGDHKSCTDRWCGDQGIYDGSKMSSSWAPETIGGKGILQISDDNPFADANHVFLYYCSSDSWVGRKSGAVLEPREGEDGEPLTLHFRGHTIIEGAVDALFAGATSDDGAVELPTLDTASEVLWTGVSAGSGGAQYNADWFASHFDPSQTSVYGVFDAGFRPVPQAMPDASFAEALQAQAKARYDEVSLPLYDAFLDQSCLDAQPEGEAWRCLDATSVLLDHVTTPFFLRTDLRDPVSSEGFMALGPGLAAFAQASLMTLPLIHAADESAAEAAAYVRKPGIYAPSCKQHVAITNNAYFGATTLQGPEGGAHTFSSALAAWLAGEDVYLTDTHPPSRSDCSAAPPDDSKS